MRDGVFKPLSNEFGDVTFDVYWLRETFGFEQPVTGGKGITLRKPQGEISAQSPTAGTIKTHYQEVRLVLGDDMNIVFTHGAREPIRIFDTTGKVIQTYEPRAGETTRELLIRLLNSNTGK